MAKTVKNISTTNEHDATISRQDRDTRIAELAYYKAENRGFEAGYEYEDWLAAEQELDSVMPTDSQTLSLTVAGISSSAKPKVVSAKNAEGAHNSAALAGLTTANKATHDKVAAVKSVKTKAAAGKSAAVKVVKDKAM